MTPQTAARMFELRPDGLTPQQVRDAFVKAIREVHPDTSTSQTAMQGAMIKSFKQARDRLMEHIEASKGLMRCDTCNGTGEMKTKRGGLLKCTRCGGLGEYKGKEVK